MNIYCFFTCTALGEQEKRRNEGKYPRKDHLSEYVMFPLKLKYGQLQERACDFCNRTHEVC